METMAKRLRNAVKIKTPYQIIAEKCDCNALYVGQIARGERIPIRGKGLKVLKEIKKITKQ
ncbi:XRE family transcriptional regulator [Chryseobacterium mulctrae]|uniref:XRE family transcriptional regulator n=1 Tax=Chryseobacterium mulctrae TaxID=2576777 RepID=UPI0011165E0C|nr:XRE family transcriptional regulator [Chryseobacterium mulctrae]